MSIAEALVEHVKEEMLRAQPDRKLRAVLVRVGQLRQVVPEALEMCYQAVTADTPLQGSTLQIEIVPAQARCQQCAAQFAVADNFFQCPHCSGLDAELLSGQELDLVELQVE